MIFITVITTHIAAIMVENFLGVLNSPYSSCFELIMRKQAAHALTVYMYVRSQFPVCTNSDNSKAKKMLENKKKIYQINFMRKIFNNG